MYTQNKKKDGYPSYLKDLNNSLTTILKILPCKKSIIYIDEVVMNML